MRTLMESIESTLEASDSKSTVLVDGNVTLDNIQRTENSEVFTATANGFGSSEGSEDYDIDVSAMQVEVTINAFGDIYEGEFNIVSVTSDSMNFVAQEGDTLSDEIGISTDDIITAMQTESVDEAMGPMAKINDAGEIEMTKSDYAKIHSDYRSKIDDTYMALHLHPKTGVTALFPVKFIDAMEEGIGGANNHRITKTSPDKDFIYQITHNGKKLEDSKYQSLEDAKKVITNMKRVGNRFSSDKFKILRIKRPKLAGPTGKLPESDDIASSKVDRTWKMISNYEAQAKKTANPIKKDHLMNMAADLRHTLPTEESIKESPTMDTTQVCKDCGDEMHKPTTDCSHDCNDETGNHWTTNTVNEGGSGRFNQEHHYEIGANTTEDEAEALYNQILSLSDMDDKNAGMVSKFMNRNKNKNNASTQFKIEQRAKKLKTSYEESLKDTGDGHLIAAFGHAVDLAHKTIENHSVNEASKPDFADIDNDGDECEDMKKAAKEIKESPTMDTTQLVSLLHNAGLSEEAIERKLNEWANSPADACETEPTSHGDAYDFAQPVNLSLKRYMDAEDKKVSVTEHTVDSMKSLYEASKNKPDFADIDNDGDTDEDMKDAAKDVKEAVSSTKVCKDCGDEMHKPTTDCSHDCDDESGSHWVDEAYESLEEAGMPASVLKSKQAITNMTPSEFAKSYSSKSDATLMSMAQRHGYGKDSTKYVDKMKKGKSELDETLEEAQSPAQKAAFAKMIGSKDDKKEPTLDDEPEYDGDKKEPTLAESTKTYKTNNNIGKAKYTVDFHDGKKSHKDGSKFNDIKIFKSKDAQKKFIDDLKSKGYVAESTLVESLEESKELAILLKNAGL